jgi:hypothetical protein
MKLVFYCIFSIEIYSLREFFLALSPTIFLYLSVDINFLFLTKFSYLLEKFTDVGFKLSSSIIGFPQGSNVLRLKVLATLFL